MIVKPHGGRRTNNVGCSVLRRRWLEGRTYIRTRAQGRDVAAARAADERGRIQLSSIRDPARVDCVLIFTGAVDRCIASHSDRAGETACDSVVTHTI